MHGWLELPAYHPLLALAFGLLTWLGLNRAGAWMLRSLPGRLASPWASLPSVFGSVLVLSLCVQMLSAAGLASHGALIVLWLALILAGIARPGLLADVRSLFPEKPMQPAERVALALAIVVTVALLLTAVAPSSRHDELSYHAVVSAQTADDGTLFHLRLPWEATVLPQMLWHIAMAPLYALGQSAAVGVVSCLLALQTAWFVGRWVAVQTASRSWGAWAGLGMLAQGYAVVFSVTTGAHSLGLASGVVGCLAVLSGPALLLAHGWMAQSVLVGLAASCMVGSKITLGVLVAALLLVHRWQIARLIDRRTAAAGVLLAAAGPVFALVPLALRNWHDTGSPAGVIAATWFHAGYFDAEALSAYAGTRQLFAWNFMWPFEIAHWSAWLWVGCLVFAVTERDAQRRATGLALFALQATVLLVALPKELRHLGGVHCALAVAGWAALGRRGPQPWQPGRRLIVACAALMLPWIGLIVFMSSTFWPVATGLSTPQTFLRQYSALFDDYVALDALLPADATLLVGRSKTDLAQFGYLARPPTFYAPRPTVHHSRDMPPKGPKFLMYVSALQTSANHPVAHDPWLPPGMRLGPIVYESRRAQFFPSRMPRSGQAFSHLEVYELLPSAGGNGAVMPN